MSSPPPPRHDRIDELLAGYVVGDLTAAEAQELERLRTDQVNARLEEFERTAAVLHLAFADSPDEPMPDIIRRKLAAQLLALQQARADASSTTGPMVGPVPRRAWYRTEATAWAAMVVAVFVAVLIWFDRDQDPGIAQQPPAERREQLLEEAPDVIRAEWSAGKTPFEQPVEGDIVWSSSRQEGYMRFRNMPVNNPTEEQYQLWIFDPERDDEPVDGGVFDVTDSGEVIIPINPKLEVTSPELFAVTIEQPGGVVVSTQERLPLVATLE